MVMLSLIWLLNTDPDETIKDIWQLIQHEFRIKPGGEKGSCCNIQLKIKKKIEANYSHISELICRKNDENHEQ